MTESQRGRLLSCLDNYIQVAGAPENWGAGVVKLLGHAVTLVKDLFLWSEKQILTLPERKRLGSAYLSYLSKHDLIFQSPELYSNLVPPINHMLETLSQLETPRRGEVLKALFFRVNEICRGLMCTEDQQDSLFIGNPIDVVRDLVTNKTSWPLRDSENLPPDEQVKYGFVDEDTDNSTDNANSTSEDKVPETQASTSTCNKEDYLDSDTIEYDESEYDEWEEDEERLEEGLEEGLDDASEEADDDLSGFLDKDLETHDIESAEMVEAVEAESAAQDIKVALAKALMACPSLERDTSLWHSLAFGESALESGSSFFVQGYARTGIDSLNELLLAIPFSMQGDFIFVLNFVAILHIEEDLSELHGIDLVSAYKNAIKKLAEDKDIIDLQKEYDNELCQEGFQAVAELVDTAIRSILVASLKTDWNCLQELSELCLSGDEMRTLLNNFIQRVWDQ